jgi:hypothetical protein
MKIRVIIVAILTTLAYLIGQCSPAEKPEPCLKLEHVSPTPTPTPENE